MMWPVPLLRGFTNKSGHDPVLFDKLGNEESEYAGIKRNSGIVA